MAEPKVSLLLTLVDKMTAPVEGAKKSLSSFGESVSGVGAKIAALGVSVALGAFFKSAIEEASKAEASTIRLGNAVKNAGANFDDWSPQIDETIKRLTKLTTYTDDDLAAALGDLITKTGDVSGSINRMGLVTDLAANKNISLEESATLVAKALNGGDRLFKEYGISTGTAAEKTDQLAKILAGSAATAADSFGGRLANLGKAWGEFKEDVGRAITANDAVGDSLTSLTAMIDQMAPYVAAFVSSVVNGVVDFAGGLQIIATDAAEVILGLPDQFTLAWGRFLQVIANTMGESRVLMTLFGDGLTEIADKMGANGDRIVNESRKNLRNLKAGHDEVIAGITATEAKGQTDRTNLTKLGSTARLEDEQKAARDKKAIWTGSANVFKDAEKAREEAAKEADAVIRASWGLSSNYIIAQTNKLVASHRVEAAALATIVDGLDGIYGAATDAAPAVGKIGDEAFNAARGAISLGKEFGAIDGEAASVLGNVVNIAETVAKIDPTKGLGPGGMIAIIGSLAGILGSIFSADPIHAALVRKNNERLAELRDRIGEVLQINAPGAKVTAVQGLDFNDVVKNTADRNGNISSARLSSYLAGKGLTLVEFRQIASDAGFDLGEKNGHFNMGAVQTFLAGFKDTGTVGFDNSLTGDLARLDFTNAATGGGSSGFLSGIAGILGGANGSSALGGLFDGVNVSDGIDAGEAEIIRGRTTGLATRFASGQVSAAELGGASNADFIRIIELIFSKLDDIAGSSATTASAVTSGGIGTVADADLGTSIDLSTAAVGG